jgi:polysaccharide deacetylase family protein (PEP-CTERM system associated)
VITVAEKAAAGTVHAGDHHFTVDVEEYFQVSALENVVAVSSWTERPSRVVARTMDILEMLAEHQGRGTFFVLGWVARRHPGLVRAIVAGGHEVASHGWDHRRVTQLTPAAFRGNLRDSKAELEQLTGAPVIGFRAPSFSIVPGREWAFDILLEEGYVYDASIFPIRRPGYGFPGAERAPHWITRSGGRLAEFPCTTLRMAGMTLPSAGGAYFRLLPYALTQRALRSCEREGRRGMFYIHPWELDPGQPRLPVSLPTRIRQYGRLGATAGRLRTLLGEFRFTHTLAESVPEL